MSTIPAAPASLPALPRRRFVYGVDSVAVYDGEGLVALSTFGSATDSPAVREASRLEWLTEQRRTARAIAGEMTEEDALVLKAEIAALGAEGDYEAMRSRETRLANYALRRAYVDARAASSYELAAVLAIALSCSDARFTAPL